MAELNSKINFDSGLTEADYLKIILGRIPILDVRAPIEFLEGSIPHSVNIPILTNEERHVVGTCYKKQGKDAAVALGHKLVSGENKNQKLERWSEFLRTHPNAIFTCFRGGLRSQTAQSWLRGLGFSNARLEFGYKGYRQWVLDQYHKIETNVFEFEFKVISGTTGSGKTKIIEEIHSLVPSLDLEKDANHRGSAFGNLGDQPSQSDFENIVLSNIFALGFDSDGTPRFPKSMIVEDESRLIGKRALPPGIFDKIRRSAIVLVDESVEFRARHIFNTYVLKSGEINSVLEKYRKNTEAISKKLGMERAKEIILDIDRSRESLGHEQFESLCLVWIEKLLTWYYDPMYLGSLEKRNPKIEFRGSHADVKDYLLSCRYR